MGKAWRWAKWPYSYFEFILWNTYTMKHIKQTQDEGTFYRCLHNGFGRQTQSRINLDIKSSLVITLHFFIMKRCLDVR